VGERKILKESGREEEKRSGKEEKGSGREEG
jgi:hypothetical protein